MSVQKLKYLKKLNLMQKHFKAENPQKVQKQILQEMNKSDNKEEPQHALAKNI